MEVTLQRSGALTPTFWIIKPFSRKFFDFDLQLWDWGAQLCLKSLSLQVKTMWKMLFYSALHLRKWSWKLYFPYMFRERFSEVYDSSQIIGNFTKTSQISSSPVECLLNKCEKFTWILLTCSSNRNLGEKRFYLLEEIKQAKQLRSTWENTVLGKKLSWKGGKQRKRDLKSFCNVSSTIFLCLLLNNVHFVK